MKRAKKNKKSKIKAIIFDSGGVIVFYDHMIAVRKMSKIIHAPAKKIFDILNGEKTNFSRLYDLGSRREVYWGAMEKELHVKIPYRKFDKLWCTIFWQNKKIFSLIKKLKKNYKIGLISNMGSLHHKYLFKKYHLNDLFDAKTLSYKVKIRKPDSKIFRITLKKLKVKPEETVFVDDISKNVNGARRLGIHGIHFKNNKQSLRELEKLGIKPK